jgi:hypothetical protein
MDAAAALGTEMTGHEDTKNTKNSLFKSENTKAPLFKRRSVFPRVLSSCALCLCGLLTLGVSSAAAAEHYVVIISGASAGESYAKDYDKWRTTLVQTFKTRMKVPDGHLIVLAESLPEKSTRDNVRRVMGDVRAKVGKDDVLLVLLIGHGTYDGETAKFNLVGPDMDSAEWAALLQGVAGKIVLINTTGSSFPFLAELSGRNRVVITATDSAAQRYDTVFPQFFVDALSNDAADLDKNGRVSVWEAFSYASLAVKQYYEQKGQLSTERSLLDDNGDKVGKEAAAPGPDGAIARATYFDADVLPPAGADGSLAALVRRKAEIELQIDQLKAKKATMPQEQWDQEFEKLAVELATVTKQIREKS